MEREEGATDGAGAHGTRRDGTASNGTGANGARDAGFASNVTGAVRQPPGDALESMGAILDLIRRGRAHSRSEIMERTGLTRGTVAQRVSDLLARGLLQELMAPSTGGRPPRQLELRADAGHILVADVGATSLDVAVADLAGRILGHRDVSADVAAGPLVILHQVEQWFDSVTADVGPPGPLWGIGIGLPGPVEFGTGDPVSPPIMPGWDRYPVRERFTSRYSVPVWVDNDVNIMALGEWRTGIARGHANVIFVKVGTGIGAGIISDGYLHRGAQGSAGDIGHIQVPDASDEICRCGKAGCLEALAGGAALGRDGEALAAQRPERAPGRDPRDRGSGHGARGGPGRAARRSAEPRAAPGERSPCGPGAGGTRQLLQPVAHRHRGRRGQRRRRLPRRDP